MKATHTRILIVGILLIVVAGFYGWWSRNSTDPSAQPQIIETDDAYDISGVSAGDDLNDAIYLASRNVFLITSFDESKIYTLNPDSRQIISQISALKPNKLFVDTVNNNLYVSSGTDRLIKISVDNFQVVGEIKVGLKPGNMAMTSDGSTLFVANEIGNSVSVVNLFDFKEVTRISVGNNPVGVAVERTNRFAYVANDRDGSLSVIGIDNLKVVGSIEKIGRPREIFAEAGSDNLWVLDIYNDQLLRIDTIRNETAESIDVVQSPLDLSYDASKKKMYVTGFTDNEIGVIDLNQKRMTQIIKLSSSFNVNEGLNNIAIDRTGENAVATNTNFGKVYVIKL